MNYYKDVEIIAGLGRYEYLIPMLNAGADGIYAGLQGRSWKNHNLEFTWDQLTDLGEQSHELNKKLFVAINRNLTTKDIDDVVEHAYLFDEGKIDAIIASDISLVKRLRKLDKDIEVHISALTSCINYSDFELMNELGVKRIVFSSSSKVNEIKAITEKYKSFDWEAVIYGGLCIYEGGNCKCNFDNRGRNYSFTCRHSFKYFNQNHVSDRSDVFCLPNITDGELAKTLYEHGVKNWKIEGRYRDLNSIVKGIKILDDIRNNNLKEVV